MTLDLRQTTRAYRYSDNAMSACASLWYATSSPAPATIPRRRADAAGRSRRPLPAAPSASPRSGRIAASRKGRTTAQPAATSRTLPSRFAPPRQLASPRRVLAVAPCLSGRPSLAPTRRRAASAPPPHLRLPSRSLRSSVASSVVSATRYRSPRAMTLRRSGVTLAAATGQDTGTRTKPLRRVATASTRARTP